jgi:hypothetical protein
MPVSGLRHAAAIVQQQQNLQLGSVCSSDTPAHQYFLPLAGKEKKNVTGNPGLVHSPVFYARGIMDVIGYQQRTSPPMLRDSGHGRVHSRVLKGSLFAPGQLLGGRRWEGVQNGILVLQGVIRSSA